MVFILVDTVAVGVGSDNIYVWPTGLTGKVRWQLVVDTLTLYENSPFRIASQFRTFNACSRVEKDMMGLKK